MINDYLKTKLWASKEEKERSRLLSIKRYSPGYTTLIDGFHFTDSRSFLAGYDEIFRKENYKFATQNSAPLIIDCGSNIGLSIVYFKQLYPSSRIIGVEPDPTIFEVLKKNILEKGLQQVELINKAVFGFETTVNFLAEGGFSGKISSNNEFKGLSVESITLTNLIGDRKVDFLKIDVEGAEYDILLEGQNKLSQVENLFIEFHSEAGKEQKLGELLNILKTHSFRYHIKEAYASPHPFIKRELMMGMEFQVEIFAFRDA
jgi:FkbM family methyltransferase